MGEVHPIPALVLGLLLGAGLAILAVVRVLGTLARPPVDRTGMDGRISHRSNRPD